MDAIRKKMQSLKGETDQLLATISRFELETKECNSKCDQHDCDIRDLSKKIQGYEVEFDETNDKLTKALAALCGFGAQSPNYANRLSVPPARATDPMIALVTILQCSLQLQ